MNRIERLDLFASACARATEVWERMPRDRDHYRDRAEANRLWHGLVGEYLEALRERRYDR